MEGGRVNPREIGVNLVVEEGPRGFSSLLIRRLGTPPSVVVDVILFPAQIKIVCVYTIQVLNCMLL